MLKKLFASLFGGSNEPVSKPEPVRNVQSQPVAPVVEEEELEEEFEDEDDEYTTSGPSGADSGAFDPETQHGLHYTEKEFLDEVEKRVKAFVEDERKDGNEMSESEIRNARVNYGNEVFMEWNGPSRWEQFNLLWSSKTLGYSTFGFQQNDENNPLLQPIHGVSLQDYAAINSKLASGFDLAQLLAALGVEEPVWAEASTLWVARMQEDSSFTVTNVFAQYFGEADKHPKLANVQAAPKSAEAQANIDRINTDEMFYTELCGARQAAYEYGIDGAQWILDKFGITLGEFQSAATKWMEAQNKNFDSQVILKKDEYLQEKQKEYAAKFAEEQGGNVADDISF